MKKILFSVVALRGIGGIESSLINLLNNLKPNEYDVDLCIIGNFISDATKIPEYVNIIPGNNIIQYCCVPLSELKNKVQADKFVLIILIKIIKRLVGYKRILNFCLKSMKNKFTYDIAISYANDKFLDVFSGGTDDYVRECVLAKRKIAWIHNDARQHGLTREICIPKYEPFDYIVNVSQACKTIFDSIVPEYAFKSVVVTNMLDLKAIEQKKSNISPFNSEKFNIVTVARIENRQKRIDRIISCCELFKKNQIEDVMWTIIGDGEDLEKLVGEVNSKGLDKYINFLGRKNNTIPYMQYADLFVQPSDYEAYSMVLIEALSVECPCVVTNYDSANNIIADGFNGWIVEKSSEALYEKIIQLMQDRQQLNRIRKNCRSSSENLNERAMKSFSQVVNYTRTRDEKN